jgi:regulatory protein
MPFARKPGKLKSFLNEDALYEYAVRALGRQMRTEAELRRLMSLRAEPGERGAEAVAAVVARLKEYGYLDDRAYAETYTRLRQENEKQGARRVRQDLGRKGVTSDVAGQAIEARYGATDEAALARQHLEKKRIARPTNEKETARVMRRLVAAGFSTGAIYKVLREWDAPEETLAALDSLDAESHEE